MHPEFPSKADIKTIRSLAQKKYRDHYGLFVVEGEKMVDEAVNRSNLEVIAVYRTSKIGEDTMSRISMLSSPSPALAVIRIPDNVKKNFIEEFNGSGFSLALDSIRDPGNMGTILRIADWFGIDTILASEDCVDVFNPKTVQASMGAVLRKKVHYTDLKNSIRALVAKGVRVYATALEGGQDIYRTELQREGAMVVMGSENNGISEELLEIIPERLFIPPFLPEGSGLTSESLNVGVATSIVCYEFRRPN